jgi:hypothetical protein
MCDAAGLTKPAGLDGESLWPVITGGSWQVTRRHIGVTISGRKPNRTDYTVPWGF